MEAIIGVFASRNSAEQAVDELLRKAVPKQSVSLLTPVENQSLIIARQLGAYVGVALGVAIGMSAGVVIATVLGLTQVWLLFAAGFGAAAVIGLCGAVAGSTVCHLVAHGGDAAKNERPSEQPIAFADAFQRGHAVVMVSTESSEVAGYAHGVLTRSDACIKHRVMTGAA